MRIHPTGENANLQQYLQQQSIQQEILAAIRGFGYLVRDTSLYLQSRLVEKIEYFSTGEKSAEPNYQVLFDEKTKVVLEKTPDAKATGFEKFKIMGTVTRIDKKNLFPGVVAQVSKFQCKRNWTRFQ